MINTIDISKSVPRERWAEFFDIFSNGNRGRYISVELISSEFGDKELINNAPLMAMVYDKSDEANNLEIEVRKDEVTYAHTVDAPTEVLTGQNSDGVMMAVQIADTMGTKTLIKLQIDRSISVK
jgi:Family of unknown function (DUF5335)